MKTPQNTTKTPGFGHNPGVFLVEHRGFEPHNILLFAAFRVTFRPFWFNIFHSLPYSLIFFRKNCVKIVSKLRLQSPIIWTWKNTRLSGRVFLHYWEIDLLRDGPVLHLFYVRLTCVCDGLLYVDACSIQHLQDGIGHRGQCRPYQLVLQPALLLV